MRAHQLKKRTKRWNRVWNIVLRNGTKYYWTDCNEEIVYPHGGPTYSPIGSFNVQALRHEATGSITNTTLRGAVQTGYVTADDIRSGKWKNARITQRIVSRDTPFFGHVLTSRFFVSEPAWDAEKFVFDVLGSAHFFDFDLGVVISRGCRHVFGAMFGNDPATDGGIGCRYDVLSDTQTSVEVDSVTDRDTFTATAYTTKADDYYNAGLVTWQTGANRGCPALTVDDYTGSSDTIQLATPAPFTITSGDLFRLARGCPKDRASCEARGQYPDHFGGFLRVPTEGDIITGPRKKG